MCSFELESIVKIFFHYFSILNEFLENFGVHFFNLFTIIVNFPYQLVTYMCESILKD